MATRTNYSLTEFLNIFRDVVILETNNKINNFRQGSVIRSIGMAVAQIATEIQLNINIAFQSFKISTAKGTALDRRAYDYGLSRYLDKRAQAELTLTLTSGRTSDTILPQGTLFSTLPDQFGNIKSYATVFDTVLFASATSVTVDVVSTADGTIGNTSANTITQFSNLPDVSSVTNLTDVTNGAERENDEMFRARILKYINGLKGIGSIDSIEASAYSVEGIILAKAIANTTVNGNFSLFITNKTGVLDQVLINNVREKVDKVVAFPITYNIIFPTPEFITLEFDLKIDSNTYNGANLILLIKTSLLEYINNIRRNEVYISEIISNVKSNAGVINIKNVKINNISEDLTLNELSVAKISDINQIIINVV